MRRVIGHSVFRVKSPTRIRVQYGIYEGETLIGWVEADDAIIGSESGEGQDVIFLDSEGDTISIVHDAELVE